MIILAYVAVAVVVAVVMCVVFVVSWSKKMARVIRGRNFSLK